jgi:hypothetical protein
MTEPPEVDIDKRYHFMPIEQATEPKGHMLYQWINAWWVVHPEKGLAFWDKGYSSPQCNRDESISKMLKPVWGEIKFMERVFAPLNLSDYRE